ncbi:MAG TPA: ubiquinone/menaquinone biosynthesis methyltransferase [Acidobacteriaceae bacterium]|jgi:demethylmenaquinone methyltransferase/2-methoxy-6-polyprenyl-1,4-benzoquinol methylase|nr:ubiquinone/menaquinone biosynthesis methyltransferase [Acidobacteriaceae bacterium]
MIQQSSASGIGAAAATGATPEGAVDEHGAAIAVQAMFNSIAPRYDLVNHVLSANIDRLWWWRTARRFRTTLADPNAEVLDICCGTGDMTMALLKHRPTGARPVIAGDFAREMLARGAYKFAGPFTRHGAAIAVEADALHLPLRDASLDLITTAFGFRNLANYREGLAEFHRVLRPGGQLGILDFSEPDGLLGRIYQVYFRRVLPQIGKLIGGKDSAYNYLPSSVSKFPPPPEMLAMMREAGFTDVSWTPYTFGIAGLFVGVRN